MGRATASQEGRAREKGTRMGRCSKRNCCHEQALLSDMRCVCAAPQARSRISLQPGEDESDACFLACLVRCDDDMRIMIAVMDVYEVMN